MVLDIPLLRPAHRELLGLAAVVVVDCPVEMALEPAGGHRGFRPGRRRGPDGGPASREERLEGADYVIDNCADLAHLRAEVDRVWAALEALAGAGGRPERRPARRGEATHPPGTIGRCPVSRS